MAIIMSLSTVAVKLVSPSCCWLSNNSMSRVQHGETSHIWAGLLLCLSQVIWDRGHVSNGDILSGVFLSQMYTRFGYWDSYICMEYYILCQGRHMCCMRISHLRIGTLQVADQWTCLMQGPWFSIRISCYEYRESHYGDQIILWLPYLHNKIFCTVNVASLYSISLQYPDVLLAFRHRSLGQKILAIKSILIFYTWHENCNEWKQNDISICKLELRLTDY